MEGSEETPVMAEIPWWHGVYADHLYETCPARTRTLPELRQSGCDGQGRGGIDPLGTDVCGWCRRVWIARNPEVTE
jgi:hypothetical protein